MKKPTKVHVFEVATDDARVLNLPERTDLYQSSELRESGTEDLLPSEPNTQPKTSEDRETGA